MVECKKYTTILILIHATCNSYISNGGITRMTTIIANLRFSLNLIVTFNLFGENIKLLVYFNIRTFLYNTLNAYNRHTHPLPPLHPYGHGYKVQHLHLITTFTRDKRVGECKTFNTMQFYSFPR